MKSTTLRLYQTLHTWVGLMAGWALFIAFFAGALTVFHEELHAWQNPLRADHAAVATTPADIDHFVNALVRPILIVLTLPVTILTLGLFIFVINALLFWFVAEIVHGFAVTGFWAALVGSILYSILTLLTSRLLFPRPR